MTMASDHPVGPGSATLARRRLRGLVGALVGLVALTACAVLIDFARFVVMLDSREPQVSHAADGIVALTGGAERIADAVTLLSEGRGRRLLITGVNQATSDGAISAAAPKSAGLLGCCIDVDRNALNTVGNALETARWVDRNGFRSIIVVTASYHMPRSLMELRRALPETELIAYPVVPPGLRLDRWWQDPGTLRLLISEYAKYNGALFHLRFDQPTAVTVHAAL